jgi:hypothetical protein
MQRLGSSQKSVYEWLKENGPATAEAVGRALYSKTSSCANVHSTDVGDSYREKRWAARILRGLEKKRFAKLYDGHLWLAVEFDDSTGLSHESIDRIEKTLKSILHAGRDGMRNRGEDTTVQAFDSSDGYYGEAFGIMHCLSLIGHGKINGAVNTPKNKSNLQWWFSDLVRQVLTEENFKGYGDGSNKCNHCLEKYKKDGAGRKVPW